MPPASCARDCSHHIPKRSCIDAAVSSRLRAAFQSGLDPVQAVRGVLDGEEHDIGIRRRLAGMNDIRRNVDHASPASPRPPCRRSVARKVPSQDVDPLLVRMRMRLARRCRPASASARRSCGRPRRRRRWRWNSRARRGCDSPWRDRKVLAGRRAWRRVSARPQLFSGMALLLRCVAHDRSAASTVGDVSGRCRRCPSSVCALRRGWRPARPRIDKLANLQHAIRHAHVEGIVAAEHHPFGAGTADEEFERLFRVHDGVKVEALSDRSAASPASSSARCARASHARSARPDRERNRRRARDRPSATDGARARHRKRGRPQQWWCRADCR